MKITQDHALFYASKKSSMFYCDVSIHRLINSQVPSQQSWIDKHNDLVIIKSLYQRCKRNNLNTITEFRRLHESSIISRPNRARMCRNIIKRLLRNSK